MARNAVQMSNHGRMRPLLVGLFMTVLLHLPSGGLSSAEDQEIVSCLSDFSACFRTFSSKYRSGSQAYKDGQERRYRKSVLRANARMALHMEHPSSYKLGLNSLMDRTLEEFRIMLGDYPLWNGSAIETPDGSAIETPEPIPGRRLLDVVPASVDWRTKGVLPPVRNQGICGSCWSHATVAATEAIHAIKCKELIPLSVQEVLTCSSQGDCGGGWTDGALDYIVDNGVTTDAIYPYVGFAPPYGCLYDKLAGPRVRIDGRERIDGISEAKMQEWVLESPVVIRGFLVHRDFQMLKDGASVGIYSRLGDCMPIEGTHAMLLVGYGSSSAGDYWIVRNSWGATWGEGGYVRIARGGAAAAGTGICNTRFTTLRPIKKPCPGVADGGCGSPTKDRCDFRFLKSGANQPPPKLSLGPGGKNRAISVAIVDRKTNKKVISISTTKGYLYGDLPTGKPFAVAKNGQQFYGKGNKVWLKAFNPVKSVDSYRNKCVVLPVTSAQLADSVTLSPKDKNANYPEDRRCVIFQTN